MTAVKLWNISLSGLGFIKNSKTSLKDQQAKHFLNIQRPNYEQTNKKPLKVLPP